MYKTGLASVPELFLCIVISERWNNYKICVSGIPETSLNGMTNAIHTDIYTPLSITFW